jgi:hypothetical protein
MKKIVLLSFSLFVCIGLVAQLSMTTFVFDAPSYDEGLVSFEGTDKSTVLFGNTSSYHFGMGKPWMIVIDSNDQLVFRKTFNNFHYHVERVSAVVKASYGNYIMVGHVVQNGSYNILISAVTPTGAVLWTKTYGGNDWDFARDITQVSDNDFVICGETYNHVHGGSDAFLMRINAQGDSLNGFVFGGHNDESASTLMYTHNKQIAVSGYTSSYGNGSKDVFFCRVNEDLDSLHFSVELSDYDQEAYDIIQSYDSAFVIAGYKLDSIGDTRPVLNKIDSMGIAYWTFKNNTKNVLWGSYTSIIQTRYNNNLYVSGNTGAFGSGVQDAIAHRINRNGFFSTGQTFGGIGSESVFSLRRDEDRLFHMCGMTTSYGAIFSGMYYVRFDSTFTSTLTPSLISVDVDNIDEDQTLNVYPNPVREIVHVDVEGMALDNATIEIIDMNGQVVYQAMAENTTSELQINVAHLSSGVYVLTLRTDQFQSQSRLIIQH